MNEPVEFGPLWFDKLNERITALENEFKDFSAWALELLGPIGPPPRFEQRISQLESDIRLLCKWDRVGDQRIGALEVELREFSNFALKRIVDLEDQLMSLRIK